MSRDPQYDVLFESVAIGPVTARNRFYQVPHCNGMGREHPRGAAAMRGVKAEGGWAVVNTEETEIHPTSDISPYFEGRLWNDQDVGSLALSAQAIHEQGSLAGIELAHNGIHSPNLYSREIPLGPSHAPTVGIDPIQARAMDKADIANLRRWHRAAALRARQAGFDIVYVYCGHDMSLPMHFLSRRHNRRTDEYGGSLVNRARLLREIIVDTKEAVGDTCAVAVRIAVDELLGPDGIAAGGEGREIIEMLAELPDLWDISLSGWANDSATARFAEEGFQEPYNAFVKSVTTKPVVGVGRFTSPDAMVRQIRKGLLDFIGAARPSIADPFLPRKIEEGRIDEIRECIGCNICVSSDNRCVPIRCTQNPTMGEEWRKEWHPEVIAPKRKAETILVVGAGPAGLECAHALGQRNLEVTVAEAADTPGGVAAKIARLPSLASYRRVADYRLGRISQMPNVRLYLESRLDADQVLEFGFQHVVLATGASWRRDGVGRHHGAPVAGWDRAHVVSPDDLMGPDGVAGLAVDGPVVVYDDDHYLLGGALAEAIRASGHDVSLVTPVATASAWSANTLEQSRIQTRLLECGVVIRPNLALNQVGEDMLELACVYTGRLTDLHCKALVMVTARLPHEDLREEIETRRDDWASAGIMSVTAIGDALAPGTVAAAVYSGHRFAREFQESTETDAVPFHRELPGQAWV